MYKIIPAAYIFTHQYLNTMQQGIQALHCVAELFTLNKHDSRFADVDPVFDWAENHKTVRILNAGCGEEFDIAMREAKDWAKEYSLPFAYFREPDMFDAITSFGFILKPEIVYQFELWRDEVRKLSDHILDDNDDILDDYDFIHFLMKFRSAK